MKQVARGNAVRLVATGGANEEWSRMLQSQTRSVQADTSPGQGCAARNIDRAMQGGCCNDLCPTSNYLVPPSTTFTKSGDKPQREASSLNRMLQGVLSNFPVHSTNPHLEINVLRNEIEWVEGSRPRGIRHSNVRIRESHNVPHFQLLSFQSRGWLVT